MPNDNKLSKQIFRLLLLFVMFIFSHFVMWNVYVVKAEASCQQGADIDAHVLTSKRDIVNSKLELLKRMIYESSTARRIEKSGNEDALSSLEAAKAIHAESSSMYEQGCLLDAENELNEALHQFQSASRFAVDKQRFDAIAKQRYKQLRDRLRIFSEAYSNSTIDNNTDAAGFIDMEMIHQLENQAHKLAEQGDFNSANKSLEEAVYLLEKALVTALHEKTLVHELRFDSVEEEYSYVLETNHSYQKLLKSILTRLEPDSPRYVSLEQLEKLNERALTAAYDNVVAGDVEQAIAILDKGNIRLIQSLSGSGLVQ